MKKFFKTVLKIAAGLVLLLLVAITSGYFYINTLSGKDWLARTIGSAASDPRTGVSVAITGLEGSIPWDMHIRSVTLGDKQGEYASLTGLHFSWEAAALLKKKIHIIALEAEDINIQRAPLLPPSKSIPSQPFSLPKLPDMRIDTLRIPGLFIGAALAGSDQRFAIKGGGTPADWKFLMKTLEGPETTLQLTLSLLPASLNAQVHLDEAPGGVLLHLLKQSGHGPLHLELDADTDASGLVRLQQMALTMNGLSLKGQGSYNLSDQRSAVRLALGITDAAVFSELAGKPLAGKADVTWSAEGPPDALAVKLEATLNEFMAAKTLVQNAKTNLSAILNIPKKKIEIKDDLQATVNGTHVSLLMEAALQDAHLTVTHLEAAYGPCHVQGNLDAEKDSRRFKAALTGPLPPLSVVAPQLHLEASGQAKLDAEGTFDAFKVNLQSDIVSKEGNAKLLAEGDVDASKQSFAGKLNVDAIRDGQRFRFILPVKADAAEVNLSDATLDGPGMKLAAKLHWSLKEMLGDGALTLNASDLKPIGMLTGQKLAGRITANIALAAKEKKESSTLTLNAKDINANGVMLSQASLAADVQDLFGKLRLNAKLAAGSLTSGTTHVDKLALDAHGVPSEAMAAALSSNGTAGGSPFSININGGSKRDPKNPGILHVTLEKFAGIYNAATIALAKPAELQLANNGFALSSFMLKIADGIITADGMQKGNAITAQLEVKHLHLDKLPVQDLPQGLVDAKLNVKGTPAAPEVTFGTTLALTANGQPLQANANADWRKGKLRLKADVSINASKLHADGAAQAPLSFAPYAMGLDGTSPVQGSVIINASLESLNSLLRSSGQRVSGKMTGNMKIAGRLATPSIQGKVDLTDGQYDQQESGVCVRGMHGEVDGSGDHLVLKQLDATSAEGGSLHMDASAALTGDKALEGRITMHNYRLFCGGMASGTIEGNLNAAGTLNAATLGGTLTFPHINIELPGNPAGQAAIPVVQTTRADPRGHAAHKSPATPGSGGAPLTLGVNIHVPGQLFVRGRGLDAEFKGDLAIKGPADNPVVAGMFESKRGQFELLDKTLKLMTADIRFEGAIPPSPFLNIQAESVTSAITIDVNLTGPAAKPELALTSTPSLPQDEILAQLLFGRELSSLGPFQVAQLAQATATLAGFNSGPGVLGKVRSFLGIDTLNVGTDSSNDVSVGAGKYITDRIYVGVTQGAKPESRAVTTEVEVYPHVSTTTGVTADGQQNLGLQWKYDY